MTSLSELMRRIRMMLAHAVVRGMEEDAGLRRLNVSILRDEVKAGVPHYEPYGVSSRPHTGAEALLVFIGGNRDNAAALCVSDRRHRPKDLEPGEVVVFDDQGQEVRIKRTHIEVNAPKVVVQSPDVNLGEDGGKRVARAGDRVMITSGSSAGLNGYIQEGSTTVKAAD